MFPVFGNYKLTKAIGNKVKEIRDLFQNDHNKDLVDLKLSRLYIDDVQRNVQAFNDIIFGTLLNLCGYELNVGNYEFINARGPEYHVSMFNKFRDKSKT